MVCMYASCSCFSQSDRSVTGRGSLTPPLPDVSMSTMLLLGNCPPLTIGEGHEGIHNAFSITQSLQSFSWKLKFKICFPSVLFCIGSEVQLL